MGGAYSVLRTERNNICVANVSDQSARSIKKNFPLKLKIKAVRNRLSDLVILNTVSSQFYIAVCKCLFRKPECRDFLNLIGLQI